MTALEPLSPEAERNGKFLRRYCEPVISAIDRICDWLGS